MTKIITIAVQILFFCSVSIVSAEDQIFDNIIQAITSALPKEWKVLSVEPNNTPDWSFSDDKCWIVKVYGPMMSGYKYFNEDGDYIGERKIFNEAILLWIAGHNFNPKLSWINRIKNRFNIAPKKLPKEISNINGYTIYGRSEFIVLPENIKLFKTSPEGTNSAMPIELPNISWPEWYEELKENFQQIS